VKLKPDFQTNLDICKQDVAVISEMWWSDNIPRIGERIQMLHYELEVVGVRYVPVRALTKPGSNLLYDAVVELHIPRWFKGTIPEWEERVKKQRQTFFAENKRWPMVDA
jgi:hypothetical protein